MNVTIMPLFHNGAVLRRLTLTPRGNPMRLAHWAVNAPFRPLLLAVLTSSFILPAQAADLVTIARDALQNDATLAAARAQLLAAEAGTDVERGALLPQVNTDASVSNTRIYSRQLFNFGGNSIGASSFGTDNNYSSTRLNLDASQALFDATSSARLNRARRQLDQFARHIVQHLDPQQCYFLL